MSVPRRRAKFPAGTGLIDSHRDAFTEEQRNAYISLHPEILQIVDEWKKTHNTAEWMYTTVPGCHELVRVYWKAPTDFYQPLVLPIGLQRGGGTWLIGRKDNDAKKDLMEQLINLLLGDAILGNALLEPGSAEAVTDIHARVDGSGPGVGNPAIRLRRINGRPSRL